MDLIADPAQGDIGLPEVLAGAFDTFEAIRAACRACEDRAPERFAAFMLAAGAAAEGRNAVTAAPSFAHAPSHSASADLLGVSLPSGAADETADGLAAAAVLLRDRLTGVIALAADIEDKACCAEAANSAHRICVLLGWGDDGSHIR